MQKKISRRKLFTAAGALGISAVLVGSRKSYAAAVVGYKLKIPGRDYCWLARIENGTLVEYPVPVTLPPISG